MVNITTMFVTFSPALQGRSIAQLVHAGLGLTIACRCGWQTRWSCEFLFHRFKGSTALPAAEIGPRLVCRSCNDPHIALDVFQCVAGEDGPRGEHRRADRLSAWRGMMPVAGVIDGNGQVHLLGEPGCGR